ncbi:hypothetical protein [Sporosalibacterium faouarense]|nr:hypothetical protein [Sporosalibacterium faouarense]
MTTLGMRTFIRKMMVADAIVFGSGFIKLDMLNSNTTRPVTLG